MTIIRRLRGAAGTTLAWAGAFGMTGLVLILLDGVRSLSGVPPGLWSRILGGMVAEGLAPFVVVGALSGLLFSGLVVLREGHGRVDDVTLARAAAYGAASAPASPFLVFLFYWMTMPSGSVWLELGSRTLLAVSLLAGAGAACGAGSLWLARRAPVTRPM